MGIFYPKKTMYFIYKLPHNLIMKLIKAKNFLLMLFFSVFLAEGAFALTEESYFGDYLEFIFGVLGVIGLVYIWSKAKHLGALPKKMFLWLGVSMLLSIINFTFIGGVELLEIEGQLIVEIIYESLGILSILLMFLAMRMFYNDLNDMSKKFAK